MGVVNHMYRIAKINLFLLICQNFVPPILPAIQYLQLAWYQAPLFLVIKTCGLGGRISALLCAIMIKLYYNLQHMISQHSSHV